MKSGISVSLSINLGAAALASVIGVGIAVAFASIHRGPKPAVKPEPISPHKPSPDHAYTRPMASPLRTASETRAERDLNAALDRANRKGRQAFMASMAANPIIIDQRGGK